MRRVWIAVLLAWPAMAQIEGRFTAGVMSFADDGAVNQPAVGGSARFYFSRRWSFEPQLMYASKTTGQFRDRNLIFWANIQADLLHRDRVASVYWFAGPGVTQHATRFASFSTTTYETAVGTGAGVRIRLSDRVFVAPQARFGLADGIFAEATGSLGFVLKK